MCDRLAVKDGIMSRARRLGGTPHSKSAAGIALAVLTDGRELVFNQNFACRDCGISLEEMTPRSFSFSSPIGACRECSGLGMLMEIDPELVIADKNKSLYGGGIDVCGWKSIGEEGS